MRPNAAVGDSWAGVLVRYRAEREKWSKMAAYQRQLAQDLRKRRQFLDALNADIRAREYRDNRDKLTGEINAIRETHGLR